MRLVTAGLDNVRMYLDDAIGSDDCPLHHVTTLTAFFARLHLHQLKLSPDKFRIGAARVDFLGHIISKDGVRPNDDRVAALTRMPMPTGIKQLRSLLGGLSYYRKFLPNMPRFIRPITARLKKGAAFDFTSTMEDTVRALLAKLAAPPILVFPDGDAVIDTTRPFRLHCDASTAGLRATLKQEQPDGSVRPIVYISRATLDNEQNWTAMELEAGCVVWGTLRLRRYLFGVYFLVFTDHQFLQQICKIGETKPRIQRWIEFLSVYNFRLSYRRGQDNANADFLSRLPLPPIAEDISGASALTDPDDLGVYLIRACGFTTPACPVPGVGLGGLTPPPDSPVLGGLPLTPADDFRTHCAPMPPTHTTARPRRSSATLPPTPLATYAISAPSDAPRPTRRTRSQTATFDGNAPSRPDYRTAARSGFAASTASAPPPLRTSPPPRSARLGSTTSAGPPTLISSTLALPDFQSDPPPPTAPLHPTIPDPDVQAAAAHLSNTLLNYSHSDWERAQRKYLSATQLTDISNSAGLNPFRPRYATTSPRTRAPTPQTYSISPPKAAWSRVTTILYCSSAVPPPSPPDQMAPLPALDGLLLTTPFVSTCPSWPDRGSCMHATPTPPVTSVSRALSKCLNASIRELAWKPARNGGYAAASNARCVRPPARRFAGQSSPYPYPTVLALPSVLTTLAPCR